MCGCRKEPHNALKNEIKSARVPGALGDNKGRTSNAADDCHKCLYIFFYQKGFNRIYFPEGVQRDLCLISIYCYAKHGGEGNIYKGRAPG